MSSWDHHSSSRNPPRWKDQGYFEEQSHVSCSDVVWGVRTLEKRGERLPSSAQRLGGHRLAGGWVGFGPWEMDWDDIGLRMGTADHQAGGDFARTAAPPKADNALIVFKSDSFHLQDKIRKST